MPRKRTPKPAKDIRLVPAYREEIDVAKLCRAMILAAKNKAESAGKMPPKQQK